MLTHVSYVEKQHNHGRLAPRSLDVRHFFFDKQSETDLEPIHVSFWEKQNHGWLVPRSLAIDIS